MQPYQVRESSIAPFKSGRRQEIGSAGKEPSTGNILLMIAEQVASIVAEKLFLSRDAKFEADSDKICQAIHNGFALALCVVESDSADEFLKKSSAMFETVFQKPAHSDNSAV